jgi:hypothetical protein
MSLRRDGRYRRRKSQLRSDRNSAGWDAEDVPTFSECVVGYRAWYADVARQLWPLHSARYPWRPGVNTAHCNCGSWRSLRFESFWRDGRRVLAPAGEHPAPDAECECGLYAWRRPRRAGSQTPTAGSPLLVIGAVASWGHLQVHKDGFRAEHACVVTLANHPETKRDALDALRRIATRYRADLVPLDESSRPPAGTGAHYRTPSAPQSRASRQRGFGSSHRDTAIAQRHHRGSRKRLTQGRL